MIESSSIDCRAVIAVLSSLLRVLPLIGKRIPKVIVLNSSCQKINFWTRMDHVLLWLYGLLQSFDFAPLFSKSSLIIYFLPSGCQGEYSNVRNIFSLCRDFSNLPYPATKPQSPFRLTVFCAFFLICFEFASQLFFSFLLSTLQGETLLRNALSIMFYMWSLVHGRESWGNNTQREI